MSNFNIAVTESVEPEINNPFDVGASEEMKALEKVKTCYRHLD